MLECHECNDPILNPAQAWYEITAYEHPRQQGGTNAVALRKRTGVVVCEACMLARKMAAQRGPVGEPLF